MKSRIFRIIEFVILLAIPIAGRCFCPKEWTIPLVVALCVISTGRIVLSNPTRNYVFRIYAFVILIAGPVEGRYYHPERWPIPLVVTLCTTATVVIIFNVIGIMQLEKTLRGQKKEEG